MKHPLLNVTFTALFALCANTASAYQPPAAVQSNTVRAAPNGDQITTRNGIESRDYNFPQGGVLVVEPLRVREVVAVDQGAGCDSVQAVTMAHQHPPTMLAMLKTHRCYRVDPGDTMKVSYAPEHNGLVQVVAPGGVILYTPAYIFGDNLNN